MYESLKATDHWDSGLMSHLRSAMTGKTLLLSNICIMHIITITIWMHTPIQSTPYPSEREERRTSCPWNKSRRGADRVLLF